MDNPNENESDDFVVSALDPEVSNDLGKRVALGEAVYCHQCHRHEGLSMLDGRCLTCDHEEFTHGMPPIGQATILADVATALGYPDAKPHYSIWRSRDASEWDNREYRSWKDFRVELLGVPRSALSQRALPMLWVVTPDALPADAKQSRLTLTSAPEPSEIALIRIVLWRIDGPGYIRAVWDAELGRIQWDLCDIGEIAPDQLGVWLAALREGRRRGRRRGSGKILPSYAAFLRLCRRTVSPAGWHTALPGTLPNIKREIHERIVAGRMTVDDLLGVLDVRKTTLTRELSVYRRDQGFSWKDFRQDMAAWARGSDTSDDPKR